MINCFFILPLLILVFSMRAVDKLKLKQIKTKTINITMKKNLPIKHQISQAYRNFDAFLCEHLWIENNYQGYEQKHKLKTYLVNCCLKKNFLIRHHVTLTMVFIILRLYRNCFFSSRA